MILVHVGHDNRLDPVGSPTCSSINSRHLDWEGIPQSIRTVVLPVQSIRQFPLLPERID